MCVQTCVCVCVCVRIDASDYQMIVCLGASRIRELPQRRLSTSAYLCASKSQGKEQKEKRRQKREKKNNRKRRNVLVREG